MPGWEGRAHVVGALSGGITNRNHVVDVDGGQFVVRLPGADTQLLEIDRECEQIAQSRAAELGFAPEVLGTFDGCLVTRFVPGSEIPVPDFETAAVLDQIAAMLRAFHHSAPLGHTFDAFAVPGMHRHAALSRGIPIPTAYRSVEIVVREVTEAFASAPDAAVPCHNDLGRGNFLRDGARLWLLDWEYSGMNDRAFDLGNLAVMNELSADAEEHLVAAYHRRARARDLARLRLMKLVSDAREATWAVVQQAISTIDFDYSAYATEHFDRLLANASTPEYRANLIAAAT